MMRSKTGRWLTLGAAVVAVLVSCQIGQPASKATLRNKQAANAQKQKEVKKQIRIKEMEARDVTGQLASVQQDLENTQASLEANTQRLAAANVELQQITARLEETKKQLARREEQLEQRAVEIYEGGDIEYVNVLLGSTDMWTFLTRADYLRSIIDADAELVAEIKADKARIEQDQNDQQKRIAEIQSIQVSLQQENDRVAELVDTKSQQLQQIENSKALLEQVLNELEAESNRIASQIQSYQNTPTGKAWYSKPFKGGFIMPVSGRVTSTFGYRVHPITGVYKLHTGVDLACGYGTPIKCAANGVVISAGWNNAYGNMIVIDHGGGVSTLYGHCSRLACRSGQSVGQGQVIGYVGSTGYSTGPHLHFEKRDNGRPVNPF